jgi:ribonuclease-3
MSGAYPKDRKELCKTIGYSFRDDSLLLVALTHSSSSNEIRSRGKSVDCNERLEFLGDSVLSLIVSEYLYEHYSHIDEGEMSRIRAAVVCESALAKYAKQISLGDYIFLGHGEEINNGRERPSITSDAFEALIAAVYLDSNSIEPLRKIILPFITEEISVISDTSSFVDHKTELQQIVQQLTGEKLEYVLVGESGPDHSKMFEIEARLNSNVIGKGKASSKRKAEQLAAKEALKLFGQ